MDDQDLFELLGDYLEGRLDETAKNDLEKRLSSDEALREQLALLKYTTSQLKDIGLWHQINTVHRKFKTDDDVKRKGRVISLFASRWVRVAASFLLIFSFISVGVYRLEPAKIADDNYVEYKLPVMRSEDLQIANYERLYLEQDWEGLIQWISREDVREQRPYFLAGLAAYEMGAYREALDFFERVSKINEVSEKKLFEQEIDYYGVLASLKLGAYKEADRLVEKIIHDQSHTYHTFFSNWDKLKIKIIVLKNK